MDALDAVLYGFLLIILIGIIFGYVYMGRIFSYWERKGVPHLEPTSWIFGNAKSMLFLKQTSAMAYDEIYRQFKGQPYCGFYEFQTPVLLLRDPQLIQTVLIEKFHSFHDNKFGTALNPKADELFCHNPFVLNGSRWKEVRSMLTPGFTPNKLKILEDIIKPIYKTLIIFLENNTEDIEAYELATKFVSEMLANFGWGINCDGFSKESVLKKNFDDIDFSAFNLNIMFLHPILARWLKLRMFGKKFMEFLKNITSQSMNSVENNTIKQSIFLQTVLSARDKLRQAGKDMSLTEITAHMSTLFLDGYETTARTLSIILFYLMKNADVQQRLREDINMSEEITLDAINRLEYMDMVITEATRLSAVVPNLTRICTEACKLGTLEVEVGTRVIIPVYSIHHDSKYYSNPENFNPEHFSEENKKNRPKCTYFGFGQGPRICLGMKYALAEIKLFLFYLLKDYEIVPPTDHSVNEILPDVRSTFIFFAKDPLYIKVKKLNV